MKASSLKSWAAQCLSIRILGNLAWIIPTSQLFPCLKLHWKWISYEAVGGARFQHLGNLIGSSWMHQSNSLWCWGLNQSLLKKPSPDILLPRGVGDWRRDCALSWRRPKQNPQLLVDVVFLLAIPVYSLVLSLMVKSSWWFMLTWKWGQGMPGGCKQTAVTHLPFDSNLGCFPVSW